MNKFYIAIAIVIACAILMGVVACAEIYPQMFVVDLVQREQNKVFLLDFNGDIWVIFGTEDWQAGDIAAAIMNDMNTPTIEDDEILDLRYTGYFEDWT